VDEQRRRPIALLDIRDAPGFDVGETPAGVKFRDVQDALRWCGGET